MPIINKDDIKELCCPKNSRALGIDYGDSRIGISVSDTTFTIASPLTVCNSHNVFGPLLQIIDDYKISVVVIGIPLSLSGGSEGKQLEKVQKFAHKLLTLRNDLQILLWDERLSTHAAMRYINEAGFSKQKQKCVKDKVAASFILQGWLDNYSNICTKT